MNMENQKLSFAGAIGVCFKKFVNFRGVASRREYWYFILFIVLLSIVLGQVDQIVFPELTQRATDSAEALLSYLETAPANVDWTMFSKAMSDSIDASPISNFVSFITLLPLLTVTVRVCAMPVLVVGGSFLSGCSYLSSSLPSCQASKRPHLAPKPKFD